jgi:hypothetical protein
MGVQISPAEKLRAHNTAIAKKVRELAETYRDVSQILPSLGNLATLFKTIAEFFLCLDTEPDAFNLTSTKVANYIKSTGILKASVVGKAERALQLLTKMINYHSSFRALTRYPAQLKKPMVKIELLTILYYLSNCSENHSLDVLADDCSDMRKMFHNWDQRLYLGARSWALGVNWCKDKWRENQAQSNSVSLDNDPMTFDLGKFLQSDDLNLAPQNQYLFNPPQLNRFEHRTSQHTRQLGDDEVDIPVQQPLAGSSRRRALNRPVARRGGKMPRLH